MEMPLEEIPFEEIPFKQILFEATPLDKDPFMQDFEQSFSSVLRRDTAGLFWTAEVELETAAAFTLIGLSNIPEATKFSISPPRISNAPCQAYWSKSSCVKGARANVRPIPDRPIAYAVANRFLKYIAVTTEKDWYSSAKPIPTTTPMLM